MKFAIISDSHDNEPNILKALAYIESQKIKTIIHCGDVCTPDSLKLLAKNFSGEIFICFGNGDFEQEKLIKLATTHPHIKIVGGTGKITLDTAKIAWNHYPDQAKKLAESQKYDLVFYGHNHTPWEDTIGKTKLLNPGTLAGLRNKATFAIYDTETHKAQLIVLERI